MPGLNALFDAGALASAIDAVDGSSTRTRAPRLWALTMSLPGAKLPSGHVRVVSAIGGTPDVAVRGRHGGF